MQTFLPYASFQLSAQVLDVRRLGKQRVEARQILHALQNPTAGWRHHPAVQMWRGHEPALIHYGNYMIQEWVRRGYRNAMPILEVNSPTIRTRFGAEDFDPPWLGNPEFHASHRSNLLRKDFDWYGQFGWTEPADLPYVWPKPFEGARYET